MINNNLDSDEEDIVNMGGDDLEEKKPSGQAKGSKANNEEAQEGQSIVRRSKRLSTLSRNKSDVSANPRQYSTELLPRKSKLNSPDIRAAQQANMNYGFDFQN